MPRPLCPRRIVHRPLATYFKPAGIPLYELEEVELGADQLEALRLADVEDLAHAAAARSMGVSRQTFDRIVRRARMNVAAALVRGQALRVLAPPGSRPANADATSSASARPAADSPRRAPKRRRA